MKGIYKLTSPSGKIYIGQSINCNKRFLTYKRMNKSSIGTVLYNSLMKYGFDSHEVKVIHELPEDVSQSTINEYEMYYINQYKSCGFNLLNQTEGGEGSIGYKHTEQSLLLMSKKGKGRFLGSKNPNFGKGCFGERNGAFGKDRRHLCLKAAAANEKKVLQYSKDGVFIQEYKSATDAGNKLNICISGISSCCLGRKCYATAGGYIWKHKPIDK